MFKGAKVTAGQNSDCVPISRNIEFLYQDLKFIQLYSRVFKKYSQP